MLEGVLKAVFGSINISSGIVSILGMLEGVLKVHHFANRALAVLGFNPWYVGGGVKRRTSQKSHLIVTFVSILGMLEGVLKGRAQKLRALGLMVSILGMLEGVLKDV